MTPQPSRTRRVSMRLSLIVAMSVLSVGLTACSGDSDASSDPSIESSLALIPARHDAAKHVVVNLYDAAWAASGANRHAKGEAFTKAAMTLSAETDGAGAAPSPLFTGGSGTTKLSKTAGYDPGGLTSDVRAGAPPHQFLAATGDLDQDSVYTALTKHVQQAKRRTMADEQIVSWLGDGEIALGGKQGMKNPFSPALPSSGRVAVLGNKLLYARWDQDMSAMLQGAHGETETLADNEDLVAAAQALDDAGVYSAMLGTEPYTSAGASLADEPSPEEAAKRHQKMAALALKPYRAYGIGVTKEGKQATMVAVLVMGDHDAAKANADKLRTKMRKGTSISGNPWSELVTSVDVSVDDAVVTGRFDVDNATMWYQIVPERDTLLNVG